MSTANDQERTLRVVEALSKLAFRQGEIVRRRAVALWKAGKLPDLAKLNTSASGGSLVHVDFEAEDIEFAKRWLAETSPADLAAILPGDTAAALVKRIEDSIRKVDLGYRSGANGVVETIEEQIAKAKAARATPAELVELRQAAVLAVVKASH
jgi:hypothetical protein